MTDAELIARLREYREINEGSTGVSYDPIPECLAAADRIEALIAERDHWKDVAGREGVCMTCRGPRGAPEPYGCSDCLNTGYCGEHHSTVTDLEAKLAKAVEALEEISEYDTGATAGLAYTARHHLAEIKGESHE